MEEYEGRFIQARPSIAGLPAPWIIITEIDNGETKNLKVHWEDARDCVKQLDLKKGDRIKISHDEKEWSIEKLEIEKKIIS